MRTKTRAVVVERLLVTPNLISFLGARRRNGKAKTTENISIDYILDLCI